MTTVRKNWPENTCSPSESKKGIFTTKEGSSTRLASYSFCVFFSFNLFFRVILEKPQCPFDEFSRHLPLQREVLPLAATPTRPST